MATLERLRLGDTLVVSSVAVLSEGFDEPLVSCVLLLRPTESRGLYIQQVSALVSPDSWSLPGFLLSAALAPVSSLSHSFVLVTPYHRWEGDCDAPRSKKRRAAV